MPRKPRYAQKYADQSSPGTINEGNIFTIINHVHTKTCLQLIRSQKYAKHAINYNTEWNRTDWQASLKSGTGVEATRANTTRSCNPLGLRCERHYYCLKCAQNRCVSAVAVAAAADKSLVIIWRFALVFRQTAGQRSERESLRAQNGPRFRSIRGLGPLFQVQGRYIWSKQASVVHWLEQIQSMSWAKVQDSY